MKFSVITAVRNNKEALRRAVASLREQTFKDYEHLIIDGASTDGTTELIKEFADDKTKYISEPDSGIYDALNKGIKLASGDIICFLHSDDAFADSDVLGAIAKIFEEKKTDAVYGDLVYVSFKSNADSLNTKDPIKIIRWWKSGQYKYNSLPFGWMPPHPALFVRRQVYENFGLFDTSLKISADYEIILRFFRSKKISAAYLPKVITRMSVGGASNKSYGNIITKSREDYLAMKKYKIPFPIFTLLCKNFRKLPQFIARDF
jgi:glycosyltransferase